MKLTIHKTFILIFAIIFTTSYYSFSQNYYIPLPEEIGRDFSIFKKVFVCTDSSYSCLDLIAYNDATILGESNEYNLNLMTEIGTITTIDKFKYFTLKFKAGKINLHTSHYNPMEDRDATFNTEGYNIDLGAYGYLMIPTELVHPVIINKNGFTVLKDTFFIKINGISMFVDTNYEVQELKAFLPDSEIVSNNSLITKDSIVVKNIKSVEVNNVFTSIYHQDKENNWKIMQINNAEILLPKSSSYIKVESVTIDTKGRTEYKIRK